jgi:hypothetical protein
LVNGEQIEGEGVCLPLSHGDAISMGASHTSTYLYIEVVADSLESGGD